MTRMSRGRPRGAAAWTRAPVGESVGGLSRRPFLELGSALVGDQCSTCPHGGPVFPGFAAAGLVGAASPRAPRSPARMSGPLKCQHVARRAYGDLYRGVPTLCCLPLAANCRHVALRAYGGLCRGVPPLCCPPLAANCRHEARRELLRAYGARRCCADAWQWRARYAPSIPPSRGRSLRYVASAPVRTSARAGTRRPAPRLPRRSPRWPPPSLIIEAPEGLCRALVARGTETRRSPERPILQHFEKKERLTLPEGPTFPGRPMCQKSLITGGVRGLRRALIADQPSWIIAALISKPDSLACNSFTWRTSRRSASLSQAAAALLPASLAFVAKIPALLIAAPW